jgi:hypothetical protein
LANLFRNAAPANANTDAETPIAKAGPQTLTTPCSTNIVDAFTHEKEDSIVADNTPIKKSVNTTNTPKILAKKYCVREIPNARTAEAVPVSSSRPIARTAAGTAKRSPKTKSADNPVSRANLPGAPNL